MQNSEKTITFATTTSYRSVCHIMFITRFTTPPVKTAFKENCLRLSVFLMLCTSLCVQNTQAQTATRKKTTTTTKSQGTQTQQGTVVDEQGHGISTVYVIINNSSPVLTDQNGHFTFPYTPGSTVSYTATCLGYEDVNGSFSAKDKGSRLHIVMKEATLALSEVTVTAKQQGMGSRSQIGQDAIRHIQPKSLADMLQLMPGSLTANPSLNNLAQAYVREIDGNNNNAMGTAVIVDGTPISNDGNLQVLSPTRNGNASATETNGMAAQTTAGRGADLRTVSSDNIESIEVIRGIPSVEYGNLTSGVVIVKTKAGRTPLEVKFKTDPFSKMAYVGKGLGLRGGGSLNIGLDWSQSYADQRQHYKGYDRITATVGYSNVLAASSSTPVTFNVNGAFYSNVNEYKYDPQMVEMDYFYKNKNVGGRLSIHGNVRMNKSWITGIDYDFSGQYAHTEDTHDELVHNPQGAITTSRVTGYSVGKLFNRAYHSHYKLDGKPYNVFMQVKANRFFSLSDKSYTNLRLGVDYRLDGNSGSGLTYDEDTPPQSTDAQTLRPRSYKDIPALHNLSAFIEDASTLQLGAQFLKLQAGVRVSNLILNQEKAKRPSFTVVEPRVNLEYAFLTKDNNRLFDKLSVTGGFGISNKMPPLLYLYPNAAYFDGISFNNASANDGKGLSILYTQAIDDTQNPDLKPANSTKWEASLNVQIRKMDGYVTFFHELHKHEYGYLSQYTLLNFRRYDVPAGVTNIQYQDGSILYEQNGVQQAATSTEVNEIYTWSQPNNTTRTEKWGIEYGWNFGAFKPLLTSLSIDGAWFHIKRRMEKDNLSYVAKNYPYVPLMPAGSGSVTDRVNTNFRFITHIPKSAMIFTTTIQVVWDERTRSIYESLGGGNAYRLNTDGTRYIVSPIGYYDANGNFTEWTPAMSESTEMRRMQQEKFLYAYEASIVKPWVMLNFRFTKEFGKYAELSFMANNFLNLKKWHVDEHSLSRSQIYPDLYFGAELKLKF